MQAGNPSVAKVKKKLFQFFDKSTINKTGRQSGFVQRRSQKITAFDFVVGFLQCCCKKHNTYRQWATEIGLLRGKAVSKQAVFDRIGPGAVAFARKLLKQTIRRQLSAGKLDNLFGSFGQVLIQDSTTLGLPDVLANWFKGNISMGKQKAVARIQTIINVKTMRFLHFDLGSFIHNDQGASGQIDEFISKGDLVIRDLGYCVLKSLQRIVNKQAYFLSRLRYGVKLYDLQGNELDLKKLSKGKGIIDSKVWLGKDRLIKVRLIMIPLPQTVVNKRIRKARRDRDRRLNHSKVYYQWLRYNVLITNVEKQTWTAQHAARAYKTRWQIEIIFKTWKSGFHFQEIFHEGCTNPYRVKTNIYLVLLFLCLFMQKLYIPYKDEIQKKYGKDISLMKLSLYVSANLLTVFMCTPKQLKEQIARHCCYDVRTDRINMVDLLKIFKN